MTEIKKINTGDWANWLEEAAKYSGWRGLFAEPDIAFKDETGPQLKKKGTRRYRKVWGDRKIWGDASTVKLFRDPEKMAQDGYVKLPLDEIQSITERVLNNELRTHADNEVAQKASLENAARADKALQTLVGSRIRARNNLPVRLLQRALEITTAVLTYVPWLGGALEKGLSSFKQWRDRYRDLQWRIKSHLYATSHFHEDPELAGPIDTMSSKDWLEVVYATYKRGTGRRFIGIKHGNEDPSTGSEIYFRLFKTLGELQHFGFEEASLFDLMDITEKIANYDRLHRQENLQSTVKCITETCQKIKELIEDLPQDTKDLAELKKRHARQQKAFKEMDFEWQVSQIQDLPLKIWNYPFTEKLGNQKKDPNDDMLTDFSRESPNYSYFMRISDQGIANLNFPDDCIAPGLYGDKSLAEIENDPSFPDALSVILRFTKKFETQEVFDLTRTEMAKSIAGRNIQAGAARISQVVLQELIPVLGEKNIAFRMLRFTGQTLSGTDAHLIMKVEANNGKCLSDLLGQELMVTNPENAQREWTLSDDGVVLNIYVNRYGNSFADYKRFSEERVNISKKINEQKALRNHISGQTPDSKEEEGLLASFTQDEIEQWETAGKEIEALERQEKELLEKIKADSEFWVRTKFTIVLPKNKEILPTASLIVETESFHEDLQPDRKRFYQEILENFKTRIRQTGE